MSDFLGSGILNEKVPPKQLTLDDSRSFADAPAMRRFVYDDALQALSNVSPLSNNRYTLALANVRYADPGDYTYDDEKEAILKGKTLSRRLRGTWVLTDAAGQELGRKQQTLANIPHVTNRGTFIHRGTEYTINNQQRLRSGIFIRIKDNNEIEAHVNILPGEGTSHRYFLDPAKGVFYARIRQAKIPLMPLLRAMGATDAQLREAWGTDLLASNYPHDQPAVMKKYYDRLIPPHVRRDIEPGTDMRQVLRKTLEETPLDAQVTASTLGYPYKNLSLDAILATTKKLLAVSRGEADVDDRDSLAYQTFHGPEDLISERLAKDWGGVRRRLLQRVSFKGSLDVIPTNALNRQVEAAILHSGLGMALEEINPADVFDKQWRISRLGEGGIPSIDAIPDEARAVQPSHLSYIDPLRTPESMKTGVDLFLARGVRKGRKGKIYAPFVDVKTGKTVYKSPQDVMGLAIAFPGELAKPGKTVVAMYRGRPRVVPREQVTLSVPHFENVMSPLGNLIPMKSTVKGQRAVMAARMLTQALPLIDPEAPLVQSGIPGEDKSFEDEYGTYMGAVRAASHGVVVGVTPSRVVIRTAEGKTVETELYNNFPYNRKTYIHQTPVVQIGQEVSPGDLLATSNYTDARGHTALGRNLRTAYIPFRGLNFEDAVVISETAARRLTSEHMYQHRADWDGEQVRGRSSFLSLFPQKITRKQLETMDDKGIVTPGTVVQHDDPLVLAVTPRAVGHHKVHKKGAQSFADTSLRWTHKSPGVVTDIADDEKGTTVLVKAVMPMQVGDKLSGRFGDKGIVSAIIPDDQMPHATDNRPFEILLNPLGIISRVNPAQMIEAALGRIAEQTGEPIIVTDFKDIKDMSAWALNKLRRAGMNDLEAVIDPETDRKIPNIFTGNRFYMKLHHMAEGKGQGRGATGSHTQEGTPAKGGETGAKRLSLLNTNALLSHGVTQVLRDASLIRGQRNEDYWLAFMQGFDPPDPKIPAVYEKFVNQLKSAGINVVSDGGQLHIMALTDKDIDILAGNREIIRGDTVRFEKGLEPVRGGLFDPKLTGGHHGGRWSYIRLSEPMPNPVMEDPIRYMLGLTKKTFREVLAGRKKLGDFTGPEGIRRALSNINVAQGIEQARAEIKSGRATLRDAAVRKLGYLKAAQKQKIHPQEWMLNKVPVLPPQFRPISMMEQSNVPLVADANYLYKELLETNENLQAMRSEVSDVGDERLAVYDAFRAVTGLGNPIHPKLQEKRVRGVLSHIFGQSPKFGTVQRRLIGSSVNLVGRAVISPNPDLDMDTVGIPEEQAWEVYRNFVIRRLKRRGLPVLEAAKHVKERTLLAREEIIAEMEERPVFIDRAPVLHRFGIMAFWPRLVKGNVLQVSPLVVGGFNADFDGDAMQYHVPVDESARLEAIELMMPSKNLLSPSDFKSPVHKPSQEYVGGLYAATSPPSKRQRSHYFATRKHAIEAYYRGDIDINATVEVPS